LPVAWEITNNDDGQRNRDDGMLIAKTLGNEFCYEGETFSAAGKLGSVSFANTYCFRADELSRPASATARS